MESPGGVDRGRGKPGKREGEDVMGSSGRVDGGE